MYQALYRKWRPQSFDEVIGQGHITETLKNQVRTGRLSHAYIFIGTRGTGKTTCARILAKAVNCENPVDGNPCGHCPACRSIAEGSAVDIVELDAASNNGVDNVRALREEAMFSPAELKKRVYIIDEVHMLSTSAFNALLKILEEPPKHLMFILATTELQKVPATILSRCQRHSFKRIDTAVLTQYIEKIACQEKFDIKPEAAELIARLAEGGARDALSLLDQCSVEKLIDVDAVYSVMGLAGNRRMAALFDAVISHRTEEVLKGFSSLWMDGKDPSSLLSELSTLMRDVLMVKVAPRGAGSLISGSYDGATLRAFAERLTNEELLCAMETVQGCISDMRGVKNPRTAAELCLVSLCDNCLGESIKELRARISRVEEQLKKGAVPVMTERPSPNDFNEHAAAELNGTVTVEAAPAHFELSEPEKPFFEELPFDGESEYADEPPFEPPLEVYQEEQPEDAFIEKRALVRQSSAEASLPVVSWQIVREKLKSRLVPPYSSWIDNDKIVYGRLENGVFNLYAEKGFYLGRFNLQNITKIFSEVVSELAGKEINVRVLPMPAEAQQTRSIEELRKFPEVKFIN